MYLQLSRLHKPRRLMVSTAIRVQLQKQTPRRNQTTANQQTLATRCKKQRNEDNEILHPVSTEWQAHTRRHQQPKITVLHDSYSNYQHSRSSYAPEQAAPTATWDLHMLVIATSSYSTYKRSFSPALPRQRRVFNCRTTIASSLHSCAITLSTNCETPWLVLHEQYTTRRVLLSSHGCKF